MNQSAVVVHEAPRDYNVSLSVEQIKHDVQKIQQAKQELMQVDAHFGIIPGTPKPTLYKAGAELLCMMFQITPRFDMPEDLSDEDSKRYRVRCVGVHRGTGVELGSAVATCSSNEEKYKWRKCGEKAFLAAEPSRRRVKYSWNNYEKKETEEFQIRAEMEDLDNTILQMAQKRAFVAMTRTATMASYIFTDSIEDLPEEARTAGGDGEARPASKTQAKGNSRAPQAKPAGKGTGKATGAQVNLMRGRLGKAEIPEAEFLDQFGIASIEDMPFEKVTPALNWIKEYTPPAAKGDAEKEDAEAQAAAQQGE